MSKGNPEQSYWDRQARSYDRSMALLGRPIPRMAQLAAEAVEGAQFVLEVAAGTGLVTTALARSGREVVATDYAAEMVKALTQRLEAEGLQNVVCEQADLYDLRFPPGTFDAVVAANVLHLVPDLPAALASLRRVLKPGGRLIVPTYCHDASLVSKVVSRILALTGFPGRRRFTTSTLRQHVESAGWVVTREETLPGLIPVGYLQGELR